MHVELLVEEPSAEAALRNLLPKILGSHDSFAIHAHQGKPDLLRKLPSRLRAYARWLPVDWTIVVLVDQDQESCRALKKSLEKTALDAGLLTRASCRPGGRISVVNRIAVEELEAWFFGDLDAVVEAYPRVPRGLERKARYRDADEIAGGTWETLERVLQRAGYHSGGPGENRGCEGHQPMHGTGAEQVSQLPGLPPGAPASERVGAPERSAQREVCPGAGVPGQRALPRVGGANAP